jgi:hypothetical protein
MGFCWPARSKEEAEYFQKDCLDMTPAQLAGVCYYLQIIRGLNPEPVQWLLIFAYYFSETKFYDIC